MHLSRTQHQTSSTSILGTKVETQTGSRQLVRANREKMYFPHKKRPDTNCIKPMLAIWVV